MATFYTVKGRKPHGLDDRYDLTWFETSEGQDVDASLLWNEPGWNLFTLDLKTRQAIFAKTADAVEIFSKPFLNHALFKSAIALLVIPFSQFIALAQNVVKPRTLIHILNIGRCGSTLAHHLFNKADGVVCLSEPETYFTLAMARKDIAEGDAVELIRACSRFHFLAGSFAGDHTLAIKHHSQSLFQAQRIKQADPDAKYIFMHRDGQSWANSLFKMAQGFGMPLIQDVKRKEFSWYMMSAGTDLTYLDEVIDLRVESVQFESLAAVAWSLQMDKYAKLVEAGLKMLPVSYNELNQDRPRTISKMFSYCDITDDHFEMVMTAFDKDSQEGTHIGRDRAVTEFNLDQIRKFHDVLALCKEVKSAFHSL